MTIMKKVKYIFFLALTLLFQTGCNDFLETSDPNNIDKSVFWTSEANATSAVNAIYSSLKEPGFLGLDYYKYALFISGEYDRPYPQDQNRAEFVEFTMKSENKIVWLMWKDIFRSIMRCNDVISNIPEMSEDILSSSKKDELLGQAYFLRGFCEWYLLKMYGKYYPEKNASTLGIPLIFQVAGSREEMFCTRKTVAESYQQIIKDFNEAKNRLPVTWDKANLGRATKGAAIAYTGQVHIWMNDYDEAIASYDELFGLNVYKLIDNYGLNFHGKAENNSESIFEMQYHDISSLNPWVGGSAQALALEFAPLQLGRGNAGISFETSDLFALSYTISDAYLANPETKKQGDLVLPDGIYDYLSSLKGQTIIPANFRSNLISQFGSDVYYSNMNLIYKWIDGVWDPRWKETAFVRGDSVSPLGTWKPFTYGSESYKPKKFIDVDRHAQNTGGTLGANDANMPVFRLSYAYLQYAEALNEKGRTDEAVDYLNKVRERAYKNTPGLTWVLQKGISKEQFKNELEIENFREFTGECYRWNDLVRWGKAESYCARRGFIKGTHEALPIPKSEMDLNVNMEQNYGY
jgi:starch-binding outer membrane protein, SusD/RagB family